MASRSNCLIGKVLRCGGSPRVSGLASGLALAGGAADTDNTRPGELTFRLAIGAPGPMQRAVTNSRRAAPVYAVGRADITPSGPGAVLQHAVGFGHGNEYLGRVRAPLDPVGVTGHRQVAVAVDQAGMMLVPPASTTSH